MCIDVWRCCCNILASKFILPVVIEVMMKCCWKSVLGDTLYNRVKWHVQLLNIVGVLQPWLTAASRWRCALCKFLYFLTNLVSYLLVYLHAYLFAYWPVQACSGVFFNKGENCIAAGRLFVEESLHDKFVSLVVSFAVDVESFPVGRPHICFHGSDVFSVSYRLWCGLGPSSHRQKLFLSITRKSCTLLTSTSMASMGRSGECREKLILFAWTFVSWLI